MTYVNELLDEAAWTDRRSPRRISSRPVTLGVAASRPETLGTEILGKTASSEPSCDQATAQAVDRRLRDPIHRYQDQRAYIAAHGRDAARDTVYDTRDFRSEMAAIDLRIETPSCQEFMRIVRREMKIKNFKRKTVKAYLGVVKSLLRWTGRLPHEVDRESVKEYLLYLVDSDHGASMIGSHTSAIRTVFDKFCFMDITLGLQKPRRDKKQPAVLSKNEVRRLLEAAVTLRDKLLLGLMYATGVRVSEVVCLRWCDVDLDRNVISVVQGKGNVDRKVMLPESYRDLFTSLKREYGGQAYLFPAESVRQDRSQANRYLSTRTVQRVMKLAVGVAGISKHATPHSLRHAFATHSFESGCDIRQIQKVLGHVRLETTTIYVRVANPVDPERMPSPIDRLGGTGMTSSNSKKQGSVAESDGAGRRPVTPRNEMSNSCQPGFVPRIHLKSFAGEDSVRATLEFTVDGRSIYLVGIRAKECRPGFWTLTIPPLEAWREEAKGLPKGQQANLLRPEFYEYVRSALAIRLSAASRPVQRSRAVNSAVHESASSWVSPVGRGGATVQESSTGELARQLSDPTRVAVGGDDRRRKLTRSA